MDYKEEYQKALERAKKGLPIDEVFPELKESEDERIRNQIVQVLIEHDWSVTYKVRKGDCIAWLGKQKEQNPVPKFNVGDYVKDTNYKGAPLYQIVGIDKECYICEYRGDKNMGDRAVMHFAFDNPYLRLEQQPTAEEVLMRAGLKPFKDGNQWCVLAGDNIQEGVCGFGDTIEDALIEFLKDVRKQNKPAEWNGDIRNWKNIAYYVLKEWNGIGQYLDNPVLDEIAKELQKRYGSVSRIRSEEDKNTLECSEPFKQFLDMVHSVDKDEFTEFEYSIINFVRACCDKSIAMTPKGIHCYATTILNIVKKEFPPKTCDWTDEEEDVLHNACEFIRHRLNDESCRNGSINGMDYKVLYEKLKAIRTQPKQEWSEEDEEMLNGIIERGNSEIPKGEYGLTPNQVAWLETRFRSLQPHWKPSEEQVEALKDVFDRELLTCRQ